MSPNDMQHRLHTQEVDVAVIRSSFATKDDIERVVGLCHQQQLALADLKIDMHKELINLTWRMFGFVSLAMGSVYFIARYVH